MIISISGNKGAGKDYTGKIIQILSLFPEMETETVIKNINKKFSNHVFHIKKWAEAPNKIFKDITGVDYSNLDRDDKELYRPLFIDFADNHMKACFGEDIWVKRLIQQYKPIQKTTNECCRREIRNLAEYPKFYPNWIITDTRLPFEFECLEEYPNADTLFIRILGKNDNLSGTHRTETFINEIKYDEVIDNTEQEPAKLIETIRKLLIKHNII